MDSATSCICDKYGCKTGSTIYLKVNTDSDDVTWVFNGNTLESLCDLRKGFEKKNASSSDTGKYICLVKNQKRYIFDVVVYDNYETYECGVWSTLDLKVHTDSKFAAWTLNGENVTSECNPQIGFKKNQAKFEDSGRYECTVDEKVINAFDVIVFDHQIIPIGGELQLEANGDPIRAIWILNGDHVVPEHPFFPGLLKHRVSFKDLGIYICKVNGIVKCAYEVIDFKHLVFKIGSNIRLTIDTRIFGSSWTLNKGEIPHECNAMTVLEKSHADFSDSGTYTWKTNGIMRCVFQVEVHDDYECDTGSTIYLEVKSHSSGSHWTLHGQSINSECDPQKGLKKKNAVIGDSGQYVYVGDKFSCKFNVIIRDYVEIKIGATLHLMDIADYRSSWKFNGKAVSSECKPKEGFEKTNVDYSDSGTYEYTDCLQRKIIFDVIVYESYECRFGSTIYLEVNSYRFCPKWTLNGTNVSSQCCPHKGFEKKNADFRDSGKYRCKCGDKWTHVFEVIVYEYLFADEFLGIRITVPGEGLGEKPGILSKSKPNEDHQGNEGQPGSDPDKTDDKCPEYTMDKIPRGIAAIITIGKYDSLFSLPGMDKDEEKCTDIFTSLHFDVKKCSDNKANGIRAFLKVIAEEINKGDYDCFVLLVGSHGKNGYICCEDFDDKTECTKGFMTINELLEMFLPLDGLTGKPKIFFIDCCRGTDQNNKNENPIAVFKNEQSISSHYSHFVIGYGTIPGASAWDTEKGGIYTQQLTCCLSQFANKNSLLSVLSCVNAAVRTYVDTLLFEGQNILQVAELEARLEKTLILKKNNTEQPQ